MIIQAVLLGAGTAAFAAAAGYGKKRFKPPVEGETPESFSLVKFLEVAILGAIFGGIAGGFGFDVLAAENLVISVGALPALSYWVPALATFIVRGIRAAIGK